jgi:hypothetical protein
LFDVQRKTRGRLVLAHLEDMAPHADVETLAALEWALTLEFARVETAVTALALPTL